MQRGLLRAIVVVTALAAGWSAISFVGGTPGAMYAAGVVLLAGFFLVRLKTERDETEPLPVRPWNRKARRIQELEGQVAHAIAELAERARTIDGLRAQVKRQAADQRTLKATLQTQLSALSSRLHSHESAHASFEEQAEATAGVAGSADWALRSRA